MRNIKITIKFRCIGYALFKTCLVTIMNSKNEIYKICRNVISITFNDIEFDLSC